MGRCFFVFIGLLLISGCTKTEEKSVNSLGTAQEIVIAGIWKTSCLFTTTGTAKMQNQFVAAGNTFTSSLTTYNDSICGTAAYSMIQTGTYRLSNLRGTSGGGYDTNLLGSNSIADIDATNLSIKAMALSSAQVTSWNSESYCGINTWTLNMALEISGATCRGVAIPAVGYVDYDIIEYIFSAPASSYGSQMAGYSYFGLTETGADGKTATTRRKKINGNIGYKKD